ncbi:MAG TPA: class D sortase [Niallia sp.]|nr:class D sortase [Niallia sp.]
MLKSKTKQKIFGSLLIILGLGFVITVYLSYEKVQSEIKRPVSYQSVSISKPVPSFQKGDKIGTMFLPRTKEYIPIYEGTEPDILADGAGHYEKSSIPGLGNHVILSGHRDTYFKGLKELKKNDLIFLETNNGNFEYKIKKFSIVSSKDSTILTPKSKPILTLTTCYPFSFIGNAPKRYIVTAELITSKTTSSLYLSN